MSSRKLDSFISQGGRRPIRGPGGRRSCEDEIRRVEERIRAIEDKLGEMLEVLKRIEARLNSLGGSSGAARGGFGGWHSLKDVLEREGFLLVSEAKRKTGLTPSQALSIARETGAVTLELDGDVAIMSVEAYRDFMEKLSTVKTSDPSEAAQRLGRYGRIFMMLRRRGSIYYDSKSRSWRMLA